MRKLKILSLAAVAALLAGAAFMHTASGGTAPTVASIAELRNIAGDDWWLIREECILRDEAIEASLKKKTLKICTDHADAIMLEAAAGGMSMIAWAKKREEHPQLANN